MKKTKYGQVAAMVVMLIAIIAMMTGCGSPTTEPKKEEQELHVHGVKLYRDGYEFDGYGFCPKVEKLYLYNEDEELVKSMTWQEYCEEHGYDEILYSEERLQLVAVGIVGGEWMYFTDQLRPVNWVEG